MYALNLDKTTNRILSVTFAEYAAPDAVFVEKLPKAVEDYNKKPVAPMPPEADLHNYLYIDGGYVYDPLPQPEPVEPTPTLDVWDELDAAYQAGYNEGYAEGVNKAYDE